MHKNNLSSSLIYFIIISILFSLIFSQICLPSQYFNGQRCAPCQQNCICTQDNKCSQCLPGFTFDTRFLKCLPCPSLINSINIGCKECCSQISGTQFICSQCSGDPYVFLKGGQCIKLAGCLSVSSTGVCSSCETGYFLMEGKCQACDPSCQTCSDSTLCLTCKIGYFNQTNINYSFCGSCSLGCKICTSPTVCSTCLDGYFLNTPNCQQCSTNCLLCTSAVTCTKCNTQSTLISGVCHLCTDSAKSGTAGCLECSTNSNLIKCNKCADTYYLTNTGTCQLCSSKFPNSLLCNSTTPIQCLNDYHSTLNLRYHLVNSTCVANIKNCKTMKNTNGDCNLCYFQGPDQYYRLSNNVCVKCSQLGCKTFSKDCQCLQCEEGYRYVNNLCVACQNLHCIKCQNDVQSCEKCAQNYGRFSTACILCTKSNCLNCDGDYTSCALCHDGYYLSLGSCYLCQQHCQLCESNIKCTKCASGYYLQSNGRCKQLPSNCIQIDDQYLKYDVAICKKCSYGYQVIEGSCYPCSQSLYNLNQCEKFCPTYYALLKKQSNLLYFGILIILLLISLVFL